MTNEMNTADLSVTGLADTLERIGGGILKLSDRDGIKDTAAEKALMGLYDLFEEEVNNLRGDDDNDETDDSEG